jgi:uncharacterized protein with von Willebrand factor type A (vWA) domain
MNDPRSAFKARIFEPGFEFHWVGIERTLVLARQWGIAPKRYQVSDSYIMYFKDAKDVVAALKTRNRLAPAWRAFVESIVKSPSYARLNQLTRGSVELSVAAAVRTFVELGYARRKIDELNEVMRQLEEGRVPRGMEADAVSLGGPRRLLAALERQAASYGKSAAEELDRIAEELKRYAEARGEAEAAVAALCSGRGYTLEGLSVWRFLSDPDGFRRRVGLLRDAAKMFRRFMSAFGEPAEQAPSLWGGISGVTQMTRYEQVADAVPHELAIADELPELFAAKVATKQMAVRERGVRPRLVIYVDKSGSMAGAMPDGVPKISAAAGLALALHRRFGAEVYLFDTEVDRVAPKDVVETLLKIRADGGTNISRVMEEALRKPGNSIHMIISDGITDAPGGLVGRFVQKCGRRTRLILIPPAGERYGWVQELKRLNNVFHVRDVAQLEKAALQAVSQ